MGLTIYDNTKTAYTSQPFRAVVDGHRGGGHEEKIYIRNDDVTKWYTNVTFSVVETVYDSEGPLGTSGISFKFIYGERRPTEAEWDVVVSGQSISLPDIGAITLADTYTYHPVWVRIYIPGNSKANILEQFKFRLSFLPRVVGP